MISAMCTTAIFTTAILTLVASSAISRSAAPIDLPILEIQESTIAVPLVRQLQQEETVFAVNSSSTGFTRATEVGITVQRGTSGVLSFSFNILAIEAETLASLDVEFFNSLSVSERQEYTRLRDEYRGGYAVPFLQWLGIDLSSREVTREDMESSFQLRANYNEQARIARQILSNVQVQNLQVSGMLTAFGTSFVPTTVFAFLRISRIQTQDGMTLTVVSQSADNLAAADAGGSPVPSSGANLNILT